MNLNKKALEAGGRALNGAGWISFECYHEPGEYDRCEKCKDCCDNVAGRIITAYLDALIVTTREELDALPVGSVVIETLPAEANMAPWVFEMDELGTWMTTCSDKAYYSSQINIPARVIYTPEETE